MKSATLLPVFLLVLSCAAPAQQREANPGEPTHDVLTPQQKPDKSHTRDLKGTVRDVYGNGLEGATVRLKNLKSGEVINTQTKKDGSYIFYDLNIDIDYELAATHEGFDGPVTKKLSPYDTRKPATRDFELTRKSQTSAQN
jgi:hypothetical protein